ncbi:MAG: ribosome biogenesis GTPase Der [Treponema sp.]|jgi:GTP-binding protein|nr:ribosome biogenesis GTPase Der [Treponema sp.]
MKYLNLPRVVLAGRPNVGKSTLFNRLLRRRRAITDPTPGVTRDPVEADALIAGRPVRLIDTGGFKLTREPRNPGSNLDSIVVDRTLEAISRSDLVVLLLEAGELTAEDEEFIELLRPRQDKLIVAVNKTEGGRLAAEAWNVLSLGFEKIHMISAEHGDNITELENDIVSRLDFSNLKTDDSASRPIRIALLGKPNTGKSTLSNRLTASAASIVSDIPGTTRDVVEGGFSWKGREFLVLDTAGIRRKSKVSENIEYYSVNRAIKSIDSADIVFLLIDALEGLSDQDKKIAALAHDKGRGIILVLNKWDTMPQIKNTFQAACDRIHFFFGQMEFAPIVALSAIGALNRARQSEGSPLDGSGVDKLLDTAIKMYKQLNIHIETGELNRALGRWLEENPPPSGPQTRFKVKYAVQSSENPVKFIIFVSRPGAVGEAYVSYLRNRIRRDLGFSLIPLKIEIRSSAGDTAGKKR